ncbi:hypothetical protein [Hymenobacter sp. GOD-10R]|uniref:hypothetical protein n=1 Tax=Hymenobacter sp. GOD-10R TaxID=3093922 RepID=UPI002D77FD79|nr:hypothetical protein [Hymenobacter sp. GOD-10R]WRQ30934.1 hypothetical protein SD425_11755 [Hymenobacter sp. GOD-10R]
MTRASLLHVLDHLSEISDAKVRELEQLATTFPYCQTAHLLLAKAAHDRGSMLASQRLRRAATYATDRQLLRQLIEFTAPIPALAAPQVDNTALPASEIVVLAASAEPTATTQALAPEPFAIDALAPAPEADFIEAAVELDSETEVAIDENTAVVTTALAVEEATSSGVEEPVNVLLETTSEELTTSAVAAPPESTDHLEIALTEQPTGSSETTKEVPSISKEAGAEIEEPMAVEVEQAESPVQSAEELLPAIAPPIRPPLEAGSSQFEFGLMESTPPIAPVYELLEAEELDTVDAEDTTVTAPVFYGVADVGYSLGVGSRMGYCLQSPDELTRSLPTGSFEPDALILAHLAAQLPAAPTRTSIDIISQFLRNKPRLKTPVPTPPAANEQADLSVKSTRAEPELASESLALIMVRQGKNDRAIEIYERLMVRQPEKMAYFADQIQKLKLSE